jgi:hypothetical protein
MRILTNHVGYEPLGPKRAVVQGSDADLVTEYSVREHATDAVALSGMPTRVGRVARWKDWSFWTIDFDDLNREGTYSVECSTRQGTVRSFPFAVRAGLLERATLSDVLYYFKGQRSSGPFDRADRSLPFEGAAGRTVDLHGGWYDATGDYGKHLSHLSYSTYFNPQQIPLVVWSLFKAHERLAARRDPNLAQLERRLLDEAIHGADYLVRAKSPTGSFYRSVAAPGPEKKPEDRCVGADVGEYRIRENATDTTAFPSADRVGGARAYEVGYRSGGGVAVAALAMAATSGLSGDFANPDYSRAAEEAFAFLEENNNLLANDSAENIVDDYCALVAATELFRATGRGDYKCAADARARNLTGRLTSSRTYENYWRADDGDRPFFHASDAGFPVVSLLHYLEIADESARQAVLDTVRKALSFDLELTAQVTNPFGYCRQLVQNGTGARRTSFFFPHDAETAPWWQGENARLGSVAAAARLAAAHFASDGDFATRLRSLARNQLNWILGLNPYDACMLHGSGRHNPPYRFFDSCEYLNAPGGICNGITSGFVDEEDIDFDLTADRTGGDHDWRWGEQWLPHAAWYLFAVSLGE